MRQRGRHGGLHRQSCSGFTTHGGADGEVGPGESGGRASMPGREGAERLGEDATRTFRIGTEESADSHLETNLVPKGGFLGETASVAAVDPPGLVSADGTGCFGVGRGDSESQVKAIEVGADQATADRGMQKLGQKQERPPKRWESGFMQSGGQLIYAPGSSKVRENPNYALSSIDAAHTN